MSNPHSSLRQMLEGMEDDFIKFFEKNNNAAGTRVRKAMKDLRDKAQEIRMSVQEMKNSKPAAATPKKASTATAAKGTKAATKK